LKLITYTRDGRTSVGALTEDGAGVVDLPTADGALLSTMIELLAGGDEMLVRARAALGKGPQFAVDDVTIEAPVPRPGKALAIGLNYRDHAAEGGQPIPQRPVVFSKVTTCITGAGKPIYMPRVSTSVDWEGELCFVIGRSARHVAAAQAMDYVAGFTIGNDVSVRDWQFHSPTWMMGKGFDSHGPIGPWLVTRDDVKADALGIRTYVNGVLKQDSNTSQLIFDVPAIIEYLSAAFTLEPGDIVFTGTPAGVGVSRKPPEFLKSGDTVRIEIDGLGALENPVVDEP
jgi:2-keto-4-pentenoate hydratase/2-oxohepta-3-ene-1,7-dioic acid hydratase in catechol pathway